MDREQEELQFLGLFGIYKETTKIIFTWGKIFSQITLALILPLSFIFLAHIEVSNLILFKIMHAEVQLDYTRAGTPRYEKLTDLVNSEWAYFWLFKAVYFTFLLIFSLLSTAAVVYTIACIYTGKPVSFKKVMSVVPKVWKRLMITLLAIFLAIFAYNVVAVLVLMSWALLFGHTKAAIPTFFVVLAAYFLGLVYMTIVWQLGSVVSVLEEASGFKAMAKSKALIRGKTWIAVIIFFKLNLSFVAIQIIFSRLVVHGVSLAVVDKIIFGVICFLLLCKLYLFLLVIQTVLYFVCKSYHHENIDKSALSNHLEVYLLGEYVPLKSKDVQLEQYDV
uniref:Uncharacterized protein MANES_02G173000 n=1 Tax=Rhizophora mucronata TaxID=61149 RepID=A0A2P2JPF2_RHIMU